MALSRAPFDSRRGGCAASIGSARREADAHRRRTADGRACTCAETVAPPMRRARLDDHPPTVSATPQVAGRGGTFGVVPLRAFKPFDLEAIGPDRAAAFGAAAAGLRRRRRRASETGVGEGRLGARRRRRRRPSGLKRRRCAAAHAPPFAVRGRRAETVAASSQSASARRRRRRVVNRGGGGAATPCRAASPRRRRARGRGRR